MVGKSEIDMGIAGLNVRFKKKNFFLVIGPVVDRQNSTRLS
jgi:hypothetical protein